MIWLFSASPWGHLEFFDAPTREFIFPSPIKRRTMILQRIKKYYIYNIIFLVPGSFLAIYFLTSYFSIHPTSIQWIKIFISIFILIIIFMNIGIIWNFKFEKKFKKWANVINKFLIFFIIVTLVYVMIKIYLIILTGTSLRENLNNIIYSPLYYVSLFVIHFSLDFILIESFDLIVWIKTMVLIFLAISTSIYGLKLDFMVYEDKSIEMIGKTRMLRTGFLPYNLPQYPGADQFEREVKPQDSWWRKGPLKNIHWKYPNTGVGEWAIFDKNIILNARTPIFIIFQIALIVMILFLLIVTSGSGDIYLPLLLLSVTFTLMLMVFNHNLPKENKQIEIIKMLPIKGSKIIKISILSSLLMPIIFYLSFNSLLLAITNYIDILTIYLSYICGPIFIILCAIGIHFSYLLVIKRIEFIKVGGSTLYIITTAIIIITLFIFNLFLFLILSFSLPYEGLYFVLQLLVLTLVNLILIIIFFKMSIYLYEKSDIRG